MRLLTIASAFPEHSFTQKECLEAMRGAPFWAGLESRSHRILEKIFTADTGIATRRFAESDLSVIWDRSAEALNHYYEATAPQLGGEALTKALNKQGITAKDIDVLLVSSCTGYLCPGVSSHIAGLLGCRENVHTQDLTGHGCGAAIPLVQIANGYCAAMPGAIVATVSVEVCSAAFYVSDEPDVLISTCLFGDGASAALWCSEGVGYEASCFESLLIPAKREKVRFVNSEGKLKNQLHKSVPNLTASAAKNLYDRHGEGTMITHGGGRDVVDALEVSLGVEHLAETREVLRDYGNLSSPSVMVALEKYLQKGEVAETIWLASFGAGFSAHSMLLRKID